MKKKETLLYALLIYLLFFGVFIIIHLSIDNFIGTDSYYHARHSQLVAESGKLTFVEPWVSFHFLSSAPADPYFLYHLITGLFISLFGITLGIKVVSALLAATIFPVFYIISKHYQIQRPYLWVFLLFVSSSTFLFRLTLERPYVLSIALLLMTFYLILKKKYFWLFLLSIFYILFYNLAPLVIFLAMFFILVDIYQKKQINLKPLIATTGGIAVGLILHPQTFNYINVIFIHFIKILTSKLQGVNLPSGLEIVLLPASYFIKNNFIAVVCFLIAIALFIAGKYYKNKNSSSIVLLIFGIVWFIIAFLIARGVEYWIPFAWLFIAIVHQYLAQSADWIDLKKNIKEKISPSIIIFFITSSFLIFSTYNVATFLDIISTHNKQNDLQDYQAANQFLISNTAKNSLIFYPTWSMFPKMFYFNTHNIYTTAFDPIFLYDYNPNIYWIWYNISMEGEYCTTAPPCITGWSPVDNSNRIKSALLDIFNTNTIIIKKDLNTKFSDLLYANPDKFELTYENSSLVVFEIK